MILSLPHKNCCSGKLAIKRSLTLFEVLIVMTLIALGLGTLSMPISKALKGEKFEQGVEQVIGRLTLAQELMLDFHTDVEVEIKFDKDKLLCTISPNVSLPPHLDRALQRHQEIKGIEAVFYNGEQKNDLVLQFEGKWGRIPKGKLTFSGQGKEEHICLKGYPVHIKRGEDETVEAQEAYYPEEILSAL